MVYWAGRGLGWEVNSLALSLHIKYESPTRPGSLSKVGCFVSGGWCRGAQNIFCLVSKVFPEEFVLLNAGLFI